MTDERPNAIDCERRGSVKEALGKLIGNKRVEAEGAAEKAAGKADLPTRDEQKTREGGSKEA